MVRIIIFFIVSFLVGHEVPSEQAMIDTVNSIRSKGCKCGARWMEPVGEVKWNNILEKSATAHADEMSKYKFFSHFSRRGEDVGQRLTKFEYEWIVVGENIAEGQRDFRQAMQDWLKSPSHCKLIMDPNVDEMGVGKVGRYWVQHFGKRR